MRKPYRHISELSDEDIEFLEESMKNGPSARIRRRAHVILLSFRGFSVDTIAEIYKIQRDTVSKYISAWERRGRDGLSDRQRSGRPSKLSAGDIEKIKKIIEKSPQIPGEIIAEISRETGIKISSQTLRRLVKKLNIKQKII